jgi:hypothetical protein
MKLIDKSAVVAEIEGLKRTTFTNFDEGVNAAAQILLDFLDTFEVKEVNIAEMADDYYDALMEEASVWMDEGTMVHCRLAYYNGCKDVLNKIQKGE